MKDSRALWKKGKECMFVNILQTCMVLNGKLVSVSIDFLYFFDIIQSVRLLKMAEFGGLFAESHVAMIL